MGIQQDLEALGFTRGQIHDGLDGLKLVMYVKGRTTVQLYEWPDDDWEIGLVSGTEGELKIIQPEILKLRKQTPARQRRAAFRIKKP
jgi:hypothetical protein